MSEIEATIFDIQRFCLHDGPGIRTTVFFKGCGLRCRWCQNPESIGFRPQIAFYEDRCLQCRLCERVCEEAAIRWEGHRVDAGKCTVCGLCAEQCPADALRVVGESYSASRLLKETLRDRPFMSASGGGLTLSGGEPVLQSQFLCSFLPLVKAEGQHILLETAGQYPWRLLQPLLEHLDNVYFDWKVALHDYEAFTGCKGEGIAANLRSLLDTDVPVTVRLPVIPGVNTTDEAVASICELLTSLDVNELVLLPYNRLWEPKINRLHTEQQPFSARQDVDLDELAAKFAQMGIAAELK
jgi:pyruvate formate lyase activating enzyme